MGCVTFYWKETEGISLIFNPASPIGKALSLALSLSLSFVSNDFVFFLPRRFIAALPFFVLPSALNTRALAHYAN